MPTDIKDYFPFIVPFLTFALGLVSGVLLPKLTAKRRVLRWALESENDVIPKELSQTLGIPVLLQVGAENPPSIGTVRIKLISGGNEIIDKFDTVVKFNKAAKILKVRTTADNGEFENKIGAQPQGNACTVAFPFFNPGESVDLEFVVSGYEMGSVSVSAAAAGLRVERRDPSKVRMTAFETAFASVSFHAMGVSYDPKADSLKEIAKELRRIRRLTAERGEDSQERHFAELAAPLAADDPNKKRLLEYQELADAARALDATKAKAVQALAEAEAEEAEHHGNGRTSTAR
jgi:hypothetical protein